MDVQSGQPSWSTGDWVCGATARRLSPNNKKQKKKSVFVFEKNNPKQSGTADICFQILIQALLSCQRQSLDLTSVFGRLAQIKGIVGHKTWNKHHPAKLEPSRLQSCPQRRAHSLIRRTNELLFNCVPNAAPLLTLAPPSP